MDVKRIDPEEARGLLDSEGGYICLDVRTEEEFAGGACSGRGKYSCSREKPDGAGPSPQP